MSLATDELLYMAKLTEQTERFEDMVDNMKKFITIKQDLGIEERNLLSVAYKNCVGSRRTAWRAISSIEQKEEAKGSKNLAILRQLKKKIENELDTYCNEVFKLLDETLIKSAVNAESKVFLLKMKGDYYRYMAEYSTGESHKKVSELSLESYQKAFELAEKELAATHPIKLGLALNFSVFYYEILNESVKACNLAKQAFDDAIAKIEELPEEQYKDSTTIMQLVRDNLTLWTTEIQDVAEEEA